MTAIPKPLKFLGPHYATFKSVFAALPPAARAAPAPSSAPSSLSASLPLAALFADVISVLGMVFGPESARDCLHFKLQGDASDIAPWGAEYVRHLTAEVGEEWNERKAKDESSDVSDLLRIVKICARYTLAHAFNLFPERRARSHVAPHPLPTPHP